MTFARTSEELRKALKDERNKVILVTGRWGTGKTTLIQKVLADTDKSLEKHVLWASLFGHRTIDQVKLAVMQDALPGSAKHRAIADTARGALSIAQKVAEGFSKAFSALGDAWQVVLPALLRGKLIVLDDIERKHDNIGIDEILGFVNTVTEHYGARCLLIMNSEAFEDSEGNKGEWAELKEKVVDHALRLQPTPEEAFDVAQEIEPTAWGETAKAAVTACGITNIRIITKIIRTINKILQGRNDVSPGVVARVVPSIALLVGIDQKGIDNAPPLDYVRHFGNRDSASFEGFLSLPGASNTEVAQELLVKMNQEAAWNKVISGVGIVSTDQFESALIDYLQSGLLDRAELDPIIQRYIGDEKMVSWRNVYNAFLDTFTWDKSVNREVLLARAQEIVKNAHFLNPYMVTMLHDTLCDRLGAKELAETAVRNWIAGQEEGTIDLAGLGNPMGLNLHGDIHKFLTQKSRGDVPRDSLLDACRAAGQNQINAHTILILEKATAEDFERLLRDSDAQAFKDALTNMLSYIRLISPHNSAHIVAANFLEACANIAEGTEGERLPEIMTYVFASMNVQSLLARDAIGQITRQTKTVQQVLSEAYQADQAAKIAARE